MDAPLPVDPPWLAAPPLPPPEPHAHQSPKPLSAACPAASSPALLAGNRAHQEMRLVLLSSWVGRPSREVAGRASDRRRGDPLPLPRSTPSMRKKKARRAPPALTLPLGPRSARRGAPRWISGRAPGAKSFSPRESVLLDNALSITESVFFLFFGLECTFLSGKRISEKDAICFSARAPFVMIFFTDWSLIVKRSYLFTHNSK